MGDPNDNGTGGNILETNFEFGPSSSGGPNSMVWK